MQEFKQINKALAEFQDELEKLKISREEIDVAGKVAKTSADMVEELGKLSVKYIEEYNTSIAKLEDLSIPSHLNKYREVAEQLNDKMDDFNENTKKIQDETKLSIESLNKKLNGLDAGLTELKMEMAIVKTNQNFKFKIEMGVLLFLIILIITLNFV
jgi:chromosome segregation ATPase